jgi:hypothetical protein
MIAQSNSRGKDQRKLNSPQDFLRYYLFEFWGRNTREKENRRNVSLSQSGRAPFPTRSG